MSWIGDGNRGQINADPFLENPFNSRQINGNPFGIKTSANNQSVRDGRSEANNGVWWRGSNGRFYTNDGVRGVVDRGKNYSPPGGYKQIADPNPPKPTGRSVTGNNTGFGGGGGGYSAPAKVLDTAQIGSLDSLIRSLSSIKDQSISKAVMRRDAFKREKEEEKTREERKYGGKKLSVLQDFAGAKTDTDLNTRNTLESLISSLSTLGLGGGRALTRQILDAANMSNRKANATQATNNRDLDSAWNDYTVGNENDVKKINDQYGYEEGEANRQYYQGKQNALYKKADVYKDADGQKAGRAAAMTEGDSLNGLIAGSAFMNPSYNGSTRQMATPELGRYTQDIAKYDTTNIGVGGLTPADGGAPAGNLSIRAMAVNDKDLGIKKKSEADLGYGV